MRTRDDSQDLRFATLVTVAFVLLTIPRLLLHELWRDEAWQWLVVVESHSVRDLFSGMNRGGTGYLFPLLCFLARQVTTSPRAMQLVNLVMAGAAAFAFARWAPLGRRERALFLLGYFPFYEYVVISRAYSTGELLVWLACAAAGCRRPALALGAVLGLLCQTTAYGYILGLAIAGGWLLDRWLRRREMPPPSPLPWEEVVGGLLLAVAGAVAGIVQFIPEPGTFGPPWRFTWDPEHARKVVMLPWRALVPLPRLGLNFWNTNALDAWPSAQTAAGLLMLALAVALLWRSKVALATFGLGTAGLLAFSYTKYLGVMRHQGHFWLLLAAALWMGGGQGFADRRSWRARVLLVLLAVHAGVGLYASGMDLRYPFSNGAAVARLLREKGLDHYPLLGSREPPASIVSLALGKPLYSPSRGLFVTRPDWGPQQREISDQELRCSARGLTAREKVDVILVMNRELPPWEELVPEGACVGAIQSTEDYHLYRLRYDRLAPTARAAGCGP